MRKTLIAFVLLIAGVAVQATFAQSQAELAKAQESLSSGNALLQKGEPEQAVIKFGEVIAILPSMAIGYVNRGLAYSSAGKYAEAIADADKAIELAKDGPDANTYSALAYQVKALVYQAQGENNLAVESYSLGLGLAPNNVRFLNGRGVSYTRLHKYDLAIKDLSRAIELDPKLYQTYVNRTVAYRALKNCDAAIRDATEAMRLAPSNISPYLNRANCYLDLKKYDEAIADLTKAIAIEPKADLFYNRALVYFNQGDYENSIADNTKAIDQDVNYDKAYFNRAISYQRTHNYELAIADFRKTLSLNEKSPSRRYNLASVLFEAGQYSEAIKETTALISVFPKWRAPVALRANAYARVGDSVRMNSDAALANKLDAAWKPEEEGFFIFEIKYNFPAETK
ncbi:MAG: tetratricopeptide repeat protein [Acidobacteria bacterium]|nr:tetratricopeptide repeat protein [Acidobacteriota bacterium]